MGGGKEWEGETTDVAATGRKNGVEQGLVPRLDSARGTSDKGGKLVIGL